MDSTDKKHELSLLETNLQKETTNLVELKQHVTNENH